MRHLVDGDCNIPHRVGSEGFDVILQGGAANVRETVEYFTNDGKAALKIGNNTVDENSPCMPTLCDQNGDQQPTQRQEYILSAPTGEFSGITFQRQGQQDDQSDSETEKERKNGKKKKKATKKA